MCGIVGFNGERDARKIVLDGLQKLEYRGYDSAGISCVDNNNEVKTYKDKGRVDHLRELVDESYMTNIAIGHTRWATHGEPSKRNSHPHTSQSGRFTIVHNGVIENYKKLKYEFLADYIFNSDTDTEVIANLLDYFAKQMDFKDALLKTLTLLEGSFALLILDKHNLNDIFFAKNKTPMIIGYSPTGVVLGSDIIPLVGNCDKYTALKDGTFGVASKHRIEFFDYNGKEMNYTFKDVDVSADSIDKGGYDHYMMKEIHESPMVIRRILSTYFDDHEIMISKTLIDKIRKCDKINLVACGTSMHAGYMGKYFFEKFCHIPSEVFCASELVYSKPLIRDHPIFIFLSQSGETADSIACMKKFGIKYPTVSITNVSTSTMANLADWNLDICAGPEIAVASTKAYIAQVCVCAILAKAVLGEKSFIKHHLDRVANEIDVVINENDENIKAVAAQIVKAETCFFIGRGLDYWAALEASLKLKEISYIHTEAFPSGELKHGSISLISKDVPVIGLVTQEGSSNIVRSNLVECQARGSKNFVISTRDIAEPTDDIIVPNVKHYFNPLVSITACQLLAYYVAIMKGNDVDKPRNLAKSVTVE